jgi:hypothetical protein
MSQPGCKGAVRSSRCDQDLNVDWRREFIDLLASCGGEASGAFRQFHQVLDDDPELIASRDAEISQRTFVLSLHQYARYFVHPGRFASSASPIKSRVSSLSFSERAVTSFRSSPALWQVWHSREGTVSTEFF